MRPTAMYKAVKQFLLESSLHGFKYLSSPFYLDRLGWAAWLTASAACGGVLCAVLWARYVSAPTVLSVLDARGEGLYWFPAVVVCPSPHRLAQLFEQKMSGPDLYITISLTNMFSKLVRGRPLASREIVFLDYFLSKRNMTLRQTMVEITEPCSSIVRACRLRDHYLSCDKVFIKDVTTTGVCCVAFAMFLNKDPVTALSPLNPRLDLVLQCSDESVPNGCEFLTMLAGETWISHKGLTNGHFYKAHITFTAVKDSSRGNLFAISCVNRPGYHRRLCMIHCREKLCGCSDPFATKYENPTLPPCKVTSWNCLQSFRQIDSSCDCPPPCRFVTSTTLLESGRIDGLASTLDPLLKNVNASNVILSIQIRQSWSKIYNLMYSETWWSLLSSLGGVFNMFVGVGVISVLEWIFWMVKPLNPSRNSAKLAVNQPETAWSSRVTNKRHSHHKTNDRLSKKLRFGLEKFDDQIRRDCYTA